MNATQPGTPTILIVLGLIGFIMLGMTSCRKKKTTKKIRLEKREVLKVKEKLPEENPFRVAVGSRLTPEVGFVYYRQLLDYIGEQLNRPVRFVDRENYAETNKLIKLGDIDLAFVCGRPYVDGHDEFGMELLVAPQVYDETLYYSYIIVSQESLIESFEGLRGKRFAFTDPMSNTGRLVPTYMLARMGETPDSFFQQYVYIYAHDQSIKAVVRRFVDGAAVDSLIWEYLNHTEPELTSKTKVIKTSPPYGIPPVVVRPDLDPELKERVKQIFLNVHNDETGREILKGMMIDKFVVIDDSAYDSIRDMKSWMTKQKGEAQRKE